MIKVYIICKSFEDLKERFNNEEDIIGVEFNLFNTNYKTYHNLQNLKDNDIVALCERGYYPYEWKNISDLKIDF